MRNRLRLGTILFFFYPHLARRNSVLALRTLPVLSATHLSTGWSSLSSALFSSMALMDDENTKISYPFCTTIRQMCEQAKMCAQKTTKRKTAFLFLVEVGRKGGEKENAGWELFQRYKKEKRGLSITIKTWTLRKSHEEMVVLAKLEGKETHAVESFFYIDAWEGHRKAFRCTWMSEISKHFPASKKGQREW